MEIQPNQDQNRRGLEGPEFEPRFDQPVDFAALTRQLVVQLRGEDSQRALSKDLGFSFNQIGKWESGATQMSWNDLAALARHRQLNIESSFRRFFWTFRGEFSPRNVIQFFLNDHRFARGSVYRSPETTRRLKAGEAQVMVADVLELMALQPPLLLGWISQLVDAHALPAIATVFQSFSTQIELVMNDPLTVFVEAALALDGYRALPEHDDRYLARHATCSLAELRSTLKTLCDHQIIFFDGNKYQSCGAAFAFGSLTSPKLRGLTRYATNLAAQRYSSLPMANPANDLLNKCVSSVRATAMSKEAAEQVGALVAQFHREVTKVVAADHGPKTNVQVCILHSFATVANAPPVLPEDEIKTTP